MDIQTKELIQLWNLLELGFELNLKYADTGIINEGDKGVVINVIAIAETAEQWNEPIEPKQVDWFEGVGIVGVVNLVNDYMNDPTNYKRGSVNSLVKLIGDKLLQTYKGKQIEIDF
ncbi:hypothetical protein [Phocaeicola sp.]